jgi:F-type H+-transporting ATPase subunit delta
MNTQDRDLARSYAEAFFAAAFERWLQVLTDAAAALAKDARLAERAQAGQMDFDARKAVIDNVLSGDVDLLARNLLYSLAQRGDLGLLPEIVTALQVRMARAGEAKTPVEVVSALPLTEAERAALAAKLADQYGAGLEFAYRVDPAILGGLVIRVGDKLIDGSVASKLAAMKQALGVTTVEK